MADGKAQKQGYAGCYCVGGSGHGKEKVPWPKQHIQAALAKAGLRTIFQRWMTNATGLTALGAPVRDKKYRPLGRN